MSHKYLPYLGISFKFFSLVYIFSFFGIIPFVYWFIGKYGYYRNSNEDILFNTLIFTVPFYLITLFVYILTNLFLKRLKIKKLNLFESSVDTPRKARLFSYFMLFLSLISIVFLAINRGFTLGEVGYGEQLELNAGNGFYLLFLYLYLPAILILAIIQKTQNYKYFLIYFFWCTFFGFIVYQFTGGSRNVFLGGLLSLIFLYYIKKIVSLKQIFIFFIGLVFFAAYFAILRYSKYLEGEDLTYYFLLFTMDSLSPIDTLGSIINYKEANNSIGFEYFFVQFYTFIPRFIWEDKPVLLYTNAMHITQYILGESGRVIFSPSIVGTSIAMLGFKFYLLFSVFTGWILLLLDKFILAKSTVIKAIGFSVLPLTFFLVRENFEYFLYRFLLTFISVIVVYFFYKFIVILLKSRV